MVIVRAANHANALVARGIDGKDQTQRGPWSLITIQGRVYSRVFPLNYSAPGTTNLSALCMDDGGQAREAFVPSLFIPYSLSICKRFCCRPQESTAVFRGLFT